MRRTQLITTAALVAACAVPATAAAHYGQNPGSPDTGDSAATPASQAGGYMYSSDPASGEARTEGRAPAVTQVTQDLRSPDARDVSSPQEPRQYSDLRSPDARDAGRPPVQVAQDLRSPDARDAGRPPVHVATPIVEIHPEPGTGFDWGDAGIGAAGMFALFSIAAGLALVVGGRRRRERGMHLPAH